MKIVCPNCGKRSEKASGAVHRARKAGFKVYCSRRCSGLGRRTGQTAEEKKANKAEYDRIRRLALAEEIRAKKREYFRRTYDPAKAREYRKRRRFDHTAYCRRYYSDPARRQAKFDYDVQRRGQQYAEFAEAWRLLIAIEREVRAQCPDRYERMKARGYFTRINERRRNERQDRSPA